MMQSFYLPQYTVPIGAISGSRFSPADLSPTVWYDPSDSATVFTDTAGTTPAVVGNAVALMLDKSQGLVLGSELITNGGFDTDTSGWTGTDATLTVDAQRLSVSSAGTVGRGVQSFATIVGRTYEFTGDAIAGDVTPSFRIGISSGGGQIYNLIGAASYQRYFVATATTTWVSCLNTVAGVAYYDNISVKELPGYHATQATVAARPPLRDTGDIRHLEDDGVDDAINVTLPSLGTDATEVVVTLGAVTINSGLTIDAGVRDVLRDDCVAYLLFDRALTAGEQTQITTWGNGVRGA